MITLRIAGRSCPLIALSGAYLCLVMVAGIPGAIDYVRGDDFDGLNNAALLPLALPWALLPTPLRGLADHLLLIAMGVLNAALIHLFLRRRGVDRLPSKPGRAGISE